MVEGYLVVPMCLKVERCRKEGKVEVAIVEEVCVVRSREDYRVAKLEVVFLMSSVLCNSY